MGKSASVHPLVTIHCVTYNHGKFIREALDSFLSQRTTFAFEIIIHDDASTDGTKNIIEEYKNMYPHIIRPIFEKKNQFSQGKDDFIKKMFLVSRGKYIAQCEGDDFWTDNKKLQKQVNFLEKNRDYALCFHPVKVFFQESKKEPYIFPQGKAKRDFNLGTLLKENFIQSNSVLFRAKDYSTIVTGVLPYDWYMLLYHAQFGKIGFIDEVMSAYRRHEQGIWWEVQNDITKVWRKHGIGHLRLYKEMAKLFEDKKSQETIASHIHKMYDNILDLNDAKDLQTTALKDFPDMSADYTRDLYGRYKESNSKLETVKNKLEVELDMANQRADLLTQQLELIELSRVWRIRSRVARILRR